MVHLKAIRQTYLKSCGSFSYAKCAYSTSCSDDLFDVLEEKTEENIGYDQWVANTKASLKNSKGRFWLGKSTPFPYNSFFVPKPVLSDSSKSKIFELFKKNPTAHDHRNLAQKFKVSLDRVKAIIRQKDLELELAGQGKTVDKEFVSVLESNLECVEASDEPTEIKDNEKKLPFRPLFACVPEGRVFNFQDAKNTLVSTGINIKSSPYEARSEIDENYMEVEKIISKSVFETSRSKFIFVDIKKSRNLIDDKVIVIVRDGNGTLRTATRKELDYASDKTWNRNRPSWK